MSSNFQAIAKKLNENKNIVIRSSAFSHEWKRTMKVYFFVRIMKANLVHY